LIFFLLSLYNLNLNVNINVMTSLCIHLSMIILTLNGSFTIDHFRL